MVSNRTDQPKLVIIKNALTHKTRALLTYLREFTYQTIRLPKQTKVILLTSTLLSSMVLTHLMTISPQASSTGEIYRIGTLTQVTPTITSRPEESNTQEHSLDPLITIPTLKPQKDKNIKKLSTSDIDKWIEMVSPNLFTITDTIYPTYIKYDELHYTKAGITKNAHVEFSDNTSADLTYIIDTNGELNINATKGDYIIETTTVSNIYGDISNTEQIKGLFKPFTQ